MDLSYDAEGRLASLGQTVGYVTRTANLTYDLEGRVSTLAYPSGFTISYHYNKDGQIEAIRQGNATLASYGYEAGGRLATRTLSNGVVTSYTYDAVERMNSITVSNGGAVLWSERYGYTTGAWEGSGETARQRSLKGETSGSERVNCYVAGERIHTLRGTTGTLGDAYWLDAASQLRGVKYSAADATGTYSGVNATTTTEWDYDAVGNRLEETSGAGTANYTVNAINQYTAVTGVGALAYSARGDLTQLGDWELAYDAQGSLLRAHNTATNVLAQYWRDAFGHRAVKDVDGNKTVFFNLGTAPLETYDLAANTTTSTIYEPGIDRPLAEVSDDGTLTFYHQDWLGSVVLLTDALGTKIQSYTYDAWGKPSGFDAAGVGIPPASFVSRFLYAGREYDIETALYHYRTRAYSPTLGRFLQPDPIDFGGGDGNLFRYVANNPINYWDPYGLFSLTGNEIIDAGLEAYSRAGQGIVNAFTGGLFDPTAGLFYDHFNKQWEDLGEASNDCNEDFATGMLGGRFAVGTLASGVAPLTASRFAPALANSSRFGNGSHLFGRGGQFGQKGVFNQGNFRTGWGWKGSRTSGRDVFRSSWSKLGNRTGSNHIDWF